MESYPHEYVLHHAPLMAVLGLLEVPAPQADIGASHGQTAEPVPTSSRKKYDIATVKRSLLTILLARNNASVWDTAAETAPLIRVVALEKVCAANLFPQDFRPYGVAF